MPQSLVDEFVFSPPELGYVLDLRGLPGGGSTIYDRSPYGNDGAITGATWKFNGIWYLDFDGTDDLVNLGTASSLRITGALTLEAWAAYNVTTTGTIIVKGYDDANTHDCYLLYFAAGKARMGVYSGATAYYTPTTGTALTSLVWYHLAAVYIPSTSITVYVNGVQDAQNTTSIPASINDWAAAKCQLGTWDAATPGVKLKGYISLARIHNRALGISKLRSHYQQQKYLFGIV